jgi:hypothetical protein
MLPSVLSLAFPDENPSLNRSAGALIPVFIVVGIAVENIFTNLRSKFSGRAGKWISWIAILLLLVGSAKINAQLVFVDYYEQYKTLAWNTSEIGQVIEQFSDTIGNEDNAWVIPYPHWVDTRLVGIHAVQQVKDYAIWRDDIDSTADIATPKLYIYRPDDLDTYDVLQNLYPDGINVIYPSAVDGRDFMLYYVFQ